MTLDPAVAAVRSGVRAAMPASGQLLVACSGGADSLALLAAAVFEGHRLGRRVVGVTVDHGLQPGSAERAASVVEQMRALGADETVSVSVSVESAGMGPEAAAREARYGVLGEVRQRLGGTVLLGHTRDDQAETVLLGLTRGSGARSLRGMRRAFDGFVRPLLGVTRAQTELACLAEGIEWWVDPHNSDPAYTRSRLRTEVMPLLEEALGPGVAAALARTAEQLQTDVAYLDAVAERERAGGLGVEHLTSLDPAIRRRVLRLAALEAGALDAELFHEHVLAIEALVVDWRGQKWIDLPGKVRAFRRGGEIGFEAGV